MINVKVRLVYCKEELGGCFIIVEDNISRLYKIKLPGLPSNIKPKDVIEIDENHSNVVRIDSEEVRIILKQINNFKNKTFY